MKKIIQFFKKLYAKLRLKKADISLAELTTSVYIQNFLESNPRYKTSLDFKTLVNNDLGFTHDFIKSVFSEVKNENIKK